MGMGEPLLNYENTKKALQIIMHPDGMAISKRRITLSTSEDCFEYQGYARMPFILTAAQAVTKTIPSSPSHLHASDK